MKNVRVPSARRCGEWRRVPTGLDARMALDFNHIVVVRYRMYLESRHLAANTINQQLAAVRHLAHEAADAPAELRSALLARLAMLSTVHTTNVLYPFSSPQFRDWPLPN